jgi:hypothetical protein
MLCVFALNVAFYWGRIYNHTNMLPVDQNIFEFRKQFFKLAGGAFRVYDTNQRLLLFSEQKAFKIREHIRVYSDESKTNEVLSIRTQQVLDISPTFDVVEMPSGEKAGSLKRKGLKSILKDEWEIYDASGSLIGMVEEDSTLFAVLRRFLTNLIPQKYHFNIGGQTCGTFQQQFNPFLYRATMDLSQDTGRQLDRRIALAAGILLLAIEGRQD